MLDILYIESDGLVGIAVDEKMVEPSEIVSVSLHYNSNRYELILCYTITPTPRNSPVFSKSSSRNHYLQENLPRRLTR